MSIQMKVVKLNPKAVLPVKPYAGNAGWDLTYIGEDVFINPGENKLLNTGLGFYFDKGWGMLIRNRGGMAGKKCLVVGAELVDSNYSGEVFVDLHNISQSVKEVKHGDRVAQFVLIKVPQVEFEEVNSVEFEELHNNTERGAKALGSSG